MTFAKILVALDGNPASDAVVSLALAVGRQHGGRIEFLHVRSDVARSIPVMADGMSGMATADLFEEFQKRAESYTEHARKLFTERCEGSGARVVEADAHLDTAGLSVSLRVVEGRPAEELARRGRLADLVIAARPDETDAGIAYPEIDAALFESGRPLLLAPPANGMAFAGAAGRHVAIAWDGSREATRAIASGLPFIKAAEQVTVITCREGNEPVKPSELANYIAGHGASAKTWAFDRGDETVGKSLFNEAARAGADMMIMGGYGHSRFREMVLGGATQHALEAATIPVLLSH